jgi:hypothetical protein
MPTVFWGIKEVVFTNWLPPGSSFNGIYFSQEIITSLAAILQTEWWPNEILFIMLHMVNAKPDNFKYNLEQMTQFGFKRAFHPPYTQDIVLSDFFLFGWFKGELARRNLVEMEDFSKPSLKLWGI